MPLDQDDIAILEVPKAIPYSAKKIARRMFWRGWELPDISQELGLNYNTVRSWAARENWDNDPVIRRVEDHIDARLCQLIEKEKKTGADFKEIDLLGRQIERLARVRKFGEKDGNETDLNPKIANRNAKPKKEPKKNYLTKKQVELIREKIKTVFFAYQQIWYVAGVHRNRFLLKSRQIGATFFFALEALDRCLELGHNQIFISASRAQANSFREIICDFVFAHTGVQLRGDPIEITIEEAEARPKLYFLGTNAKTAQGRTGDVYIDECFWIHDFAKIKMVASAMATLKQYRRTYFSTPSTRSHPAWELWTGDAYNKNKAKDRKVRIDLNCEGIKNGMLFGDRIWRQIVTIHDAVNGGNPYIDIEELRDECSEDEFKLIYECQPLDDTQASFPLSLIMPCMVDTLEVWPGYNPYALNQKKLGKVWLSCDPSHSAQGDPAAIMVIAPPNDKNGKFRILERSKFRGLEFEKLADKIKNLVKKYDVEEIIIDKTGVGEGVFQLVQKFFPKAQGVQFSPLAKSQLVHKGQLVFREKRIQFDGGFIDIAIDLNSIHPKLTKSQEQLTYASRRSSEGHGEYGWCLLLGLSLEPYGGENKKKGFFKAQSND